MARILVAMTMLWPLAQAAAVAATVHGSNGVGPASVYLAGSRVCHQRSERSFHTAGVQWPVCARCSGLYAGAAVGAWLGLTARVRRSTTGTRGRALLVISSVPTLLTWVAEWTAGLPVTNIARATAALPLGAAMAAAIVGMVSTSPKANQVN